MRKQVWSFLSAAILTAGGVMVYGAEGDEFELPPIMDVDKVILEDLDEESAPAPEAPELEAPELEAPVLEAPELAAPSEPAPMLEDLPGLDEAAEISGLSEPAEPMEIEAPVEVAQIPNANEEIALPADITEAPILDAPVAAPGMEAPITDLIPSPVDEAPALTIPTVDELPSSTIPTRLPEVPELEKKAVPVDSTKTAKLAEPEETPEVTTKEDYGTSTDKPNTNPLDTTAVVMAGARANRARAAAAPCRECNNNGQLFHRCPRPDSGYIPQYPRRNPPRMRGPMMDPYYTLRGPRDFEDPNPRPIGP